MTLSPSDSLPSPPPADNAPETFLPPSIDSAKIHNGESYAYHSSIPKAILENMSEPCVLGVDEAGRGPVLGPMVYAAAYCLKSYSPTLTSLGFMDSKKLTAPVRASLMRDLCYPNSTPSPNPSTSTLHHSLGFSTHSLSPLSISTSMLRPSHIGSYNLNAQAHDTTISLIRHITSTLNINVTEIYIDTVGPPGPYQQKLEKLFPRVGSITVSKKADSIYPIVSAASVCAKVTRDVALEVAGGCDPRVGEEAAIALGSGYPSDPKTVAYLKGSLDPVFGWRGDLVRFSWGTVKELLEKDGRAVGVDWVDGEEREEGEQSIMAFFGGGKGGKEEGEVLGRWWGEGVNEEDL